MSVAAISCSPKNPLRRRFSRCILIHNARCLVQLTFYTFGSYHRVRSATLRLNTAAFMAFWHELFSYIAQHVSTNKWPSLEHAVQCQLEVWHYIFSNVAVQCQQFGSTVSAVCQYSVSTVNPTQRSHAYVMRLYVIPTKMKDINITNSI